MGGLGRRPEWWCRAGSDGPGAVPPGWISGARPASAGVRRAGIAPGVPGAPPAGRVIAGPGARMVGAPALRAGTTPAPVNAAGRLVAAIAGRPWFTEANNSWLRWRPAGAASARQWAACAAHADTRAAAAVGRALMPPWPPLKLTWVVVLLMTVRL